MRLFKRSANDKGTAIERAYFDADRGHILLALARMADIREEFPRDAGLEYAEGILRKDFLGQGLRALEQFRLAQKYAPNHLFSAYNAAKYADSENDYRERVAHVRRLAPNDPDLVYFTHVDQALANGQNWGELLTNFVVAAQQQTQNGDCAAVAELAIAAGEWNRSEEIGLRHARCGSLRELDRTEEATRRVRHEDYPPCERIALEEAQAELDRVLELGPSDPKMLNFKSAWLILKRRYEEAIVAADEVLLIQPSGYLKPLTNKAWALFHLGRLGEARDIAKRVMEEAKDLGAEFADDVAKAHGLIESISAAAEKPTDDYLLTTIAENCIRSAKLTGDEARNLWQAKFGDFDLTCAIQSRCARYGEKWHDDYVTQTAELLHDFCPEWVLSALLELTKVNQAAYAHYLHAGLYVAAQADGVMRHDACRFIVLVMLCALDPEAIRGSYREAVLAPAVVDERFAALAERMRQELERLNTELPRLIADQQPLAEHEQLKARNVTLSRFREGITRDQMPTRRSGLFAGIISALRSLLQGCCGGRNHNS
jgi:hypothetical protein